SQEYSKLTKTKLRIMAKEKNLRIVTSQTKDELVNLLEQYELEEAGCNNDTKYFNRTSSQ
ncbi:MAG: hypothetical protein Q8P20_00180, partial [bacterium]|nr:hypothetical protein [bacterium]